MWEESLFEANGFQKEIGSCDRRYFLLWEGEGWSLGGVNRTVGKFQEKRTCSFCPKKFHAKFNFAHIQIYTMVYIYLQYIDHYHECLISRANFAIFLFPWVFDYIIQVPAVTKYV